MELRFSIAHKGLTAEIAELWRLCFGDPEGYINFYINEAFNPGHVLVAFSGDRLCAMLTMVPVDATAGGHVLTGRYVFAVATHPDFQGRGISTALLDKAHERMRAEGADFSILVPAEGRLFDFYKKRGYLAATYLDFAEFGHTEEMEPLSLTPINADELLPLRDAHFAKSALYCGWKADTLSFLAAECRYQGGEVWGFNHDNSPGYAFCYPYGDSIEVKECVPPKAAGALAAALIKKYGKSRCRVRLPAKIGEGSPFAMIYWYGDAADLNAGSPPYISLVLD